MKNRRSERAKKQAVVLLSGGLDSAVALYIALGGGYKCSCLIFDYGQRLRREIRSAKKIAQKAGCPFQILKISLPWKGSSLLDSSIPVPKPENRQILRQAQDTSPKDAERKPSAGKPANSIPTTYVPGRNIIFLSFALSFAESVGASAIFIGAHSQDYSGYPDCRPEFFRSFAKVAASGTRAGIEKRKIEVKAPLINKSKAQIIRLGSRLGAPFDLTWSCYRGGGVPCEECDSCYYRAKGFKEAGLKDPLLKR